MCIHSVLNNYSRMLKGLIATDMSDADIYKLGTILREENVSIAMFDENNAMTYPSSSLDTNSALTEDELNHLKMDCCD